MNDRINALARFRPSQVIIETETIEESDSSESVNLDPIEDVHAESRNLSELCERLEENITILEGLYKSQSVQHDSRIDAMRREIGTISNNLRSRLKQLKKENDASSEEGASLRMLRNIQNTTTKRFVTLMQRYQLIQAQYQQTQREAIHREVQIVRPELTTTEIDLMIDHGEQVQVLTSSLIEGDRQKDKSTLALVHIKEQHADILELERNIVELYELFVDMSTLVDQQGEMVDNICHHVDNAATWTGAALSEITQARKYKSKERKKCCMLCGSCTALCGMAVTGIGLGLAPLAACTIQ